MTVQHDIATVSGHDKVPHVSDCPICDSKGNEWFVAPDLHYGNSGFWSVHRCHSCYHAYQWPIPADDSVLRHFYPNQYYAYRAPRIAYPPRPKTFGLKSRYQYLKFVQRYSHLNVSYNPIGILIGKRLFRKPFGLQIPVFKPGGRILDFGCGSGSLIAFLRALGWNAEGIEVDESAARVGRDAGLPIICGSTEILEQYTEKYDHIMAFHSLEHVVDVKRFFRAAWSALKVGGTLRIDVPNGNSLAVDTFRGKAYYVTMPVHVHLFSPRSLRLALTEAHFRDLQIKTFNVPESSAASWCVHYLSKTGRSLSFRSVRTREQWLGSLATTFLRLRARFQDRGDCIAAVAVR